MTVNEAIVILRNTAWLGKVEDAVEVVSKALEKNGDAISRRAAIDAIIKETYADGAYGYADAKALVDALDGLPSAQPEPCEHVVSAVAVEEMLKNLLPERGMWEIEGDDAKTAICETIHDALDGLWRLPFVKPDIIRCRDCKDYKEGINIDGKPFTRCNGSPRTYGHTLPDWYCADAERRTDEQTVSE